MVVETLLRVFENAGIEVQPFHYRMRAGVEIDLILEVNLAAAGCCR